MGQDFKDNIPPSGDGMMYDVKYADGTVAKASIKLSAENAQLGDSVGAQLINQLAVKDTGGNPVSAVVSQRDFYDSQMEYLHGRAGNVHRLNSRFAPVQRTDAQGRPVQPASNRLRLVQFVAAANYYYQDTFVVDGVACTAKVQGGGSEMLDGFFVVGDLVSALLQPNTPTGKLVFRSGGMPSVPDVFGNASDGDLYIAAGQTVVLPVAVPHQSVVVRNYRSITIEAGGVLRCAQPNTGLVLRCKRDCIIHGTIDQSLMSPKTNPSNNYPYPAELMCGAGGSGGKGRHLTKGPFFSGGIGMPARPYGGGWSAGGGGAGFQDTGGNAGGRGGDANPITVNIPNEWLFVGGRVGGGDEKNGQHGGGAASARAVTPNGASANGTTSQYASGGAGNYGGGVVMLYLAAGVLIDGNILCNGGNGGAGGLSESEATGGSGASGGSGGGAGGGAIYIVYKDYKTITGNLNANGGACGWAYRSEYLGQNGGIGAVTIKQYVRGMTV